MVIILPFILFLFFTMSQLGPIQVDANMCREGLVLADIGWRWRLAIVGLRSGFFDISNRASDTRRKCAVARGRFHKAIDIGPTLGPLVANMANTLARVGPWCREVINPPHLPTGTIQSWFVGACARGWDGRGSINPPASPLEAVQAIS